MPPHILSGLLKSTEELQIHKMFIHINADIIHYRPANVAQGEDNTFGGMCHSIFPSLSALSAKGNGHQVWTTHYRSTVIGSAFDSRRRGLCRHFFIES